MGDCLFGKVDLVLMDPPYIGRSKAGKAISKHDVFTRKNIMDLVELCLEVMAPGPMDIYFSLDYGLWKVSDATASK